MKEKFRKDNDKATRTQPKERWEGLSMEMYEETLSCDWIRTSMYIPTLSLISLSSKMHMRTCNPAKQDTHVHIHSSYMSKLVFLHDHIFRQNAKYSQ